MFPTQDTVTALLEFIARAEFRFRQHNSSEAATQAGVKGERYYTTSQQFLDQAVAPNPAVFRVTRPQARLAALSRAAWADADVAGKRVLFLLPSQALGSNVATLLFLHAFAEQRRPAKIGVFCARSTADIYDRSAIIQNYPLWVSRRDLKRWDLIVDLGHLESRRNIDLWPVDMEAELLEAFGLEPAEGYPADARALPTDRPLRIGILPLASSPIRTLPPEATVALAHYLSGEGDLSIALNRDQQQGRLHAQSVAGKLPETAHVIDGFDSIGALLDYLSGLDYAVLADSGPAHMTKLFGTPGVAVYSSAPADILQGRFRNLSAWTVPYSGPHCATPCGLAKIRQTASGRIGCMGSLGVSVDQLPTTPTRPDPAAVTRLMREPVPCIAALAAEPAALVDFVRQDLSSQRRAASR
ncbi:glycosyltransferase family 9 protein [Oceanibacterium hippocampi]|uniref:Uncharacterized protein n=1 Tax=Oceanibacterium hippocampi TaxID=745714 RepID=A0A1Y5RM34_9PROT|nr:glycosyltransferase family 9 protein [Oceanibacterium hippocampi]SLN20309.1 hypothetical protein OCH7691_00491 [Oceanibacterium hippocampi]